MKRKLFVGLAAVGVILLLGAIVVGSGVIPVKASSGHWPWTAAFLEFAMERSVTTHSLGIKPPPLDDERLVMRGAGHYDVGCYWCHGGPQGQPPRVPLYMTPHPPSLSETVPEWKDRQLFTIVRHGVMFTAMPAWPAPTRADEVWAVTAFIRRMPNMDQAEYDRLTGRQLVAEVRSKMQQATSAGQAGVIPEVVVLKCVACHADDGLGRAAYPKLAGQSYEVLVGALESYREASRHSGIMGPIAHQLDDRAIEQAAKYYAALPPFEATAAVPDANATAAETIVREGMPTQRVGACSSCHGPSAAERSPHYPRLAGQDAGYLVQQLMLFREGRRGGTDREHLMHSVATSLDDDQIRSLARYYAFQSEDRRE